ncbi:MAG: nicotinate-nucleotide adenylyltransferase [Thermoleophilia bacterium]
MKLAIMGGTFNPIHIGHLVCAEEAVSRYRLDKALFMPTGFPPHKEILEGASSEHRFRMCTIAIEGNPRFEVSRFEIDRRQVSYTVNTIRHFRREMPDAELYFITGADAVLEILEWKDPQELLTMATLIAATRPGYPLDKISGALDVFLRENRVKIIEIPGIGVSSTLIRNRVAEGKSIRYLVLEGVRQFIQEKGLYRKT